MASGSHEQSPDRRYVNHTRILRSLELADGADDVVHVHVAQRVLEQRVAGRVRRVHVEEVRQVHACGHRYSGAHMFEQHVDGGGGGGGKH